MSAALKLSDFLNSIATLLVQCLPKPEMNSEYITIVFFEHLNMFENSTYASMKDAIEIILHLPRVSMSKDSNIIGQPYSKNLFAQFTLLGIDIMQQCLMIRNVFPNADKMIMFVLMEPQYACAYAIISDCQDIVDQGFLES